MASPQKENGYTPIASELLDAMCRLHLSGNEWSFVLALIRKTYGFQKKEDWVTNTQISKMTGMGSNRVSEVKKTLIGIKIVTENRNKISLQKDYTQWRKFRKTGTKVPENRKSEFQKTGYTIDTITIDNKCDESQALIEKDMAWKKYNENQHSDDTPTVDMESGEVVNQEQVDKTAQKELTGKKNKLIDWLIEWQGRDVLKTNRPKQMKALNELVKMKVSRQEIVNIIKEQEQSDYWKGKAEKPDFSTVVSIIQRRG